jgi:hypothetical protein
LPWGAPSRLTSKPGSLVIVMSTTLVVVAATEVFFSGSPEAAKVAGGDKTGARGGEEARSAERYQVSVKMHGEAMTRAAGAAQQRGQPP